MALNYYDILGVARDATVEEVKKAYKKAALQHHPDKGGDAETFQQCHAAAETLSDERKRTAYDAQLLRARSLDGLRRGEPAVPPERRGSSMAPPRTSTSQNRPPRPWSGAAVEIPSDPASLSIKELKELLANLGIDHEGALEKADLLALLSQRKRAETPGRPPKPSTPRPAPEAKPLGRALRVKVMSLGSGGVGKSTLIKRYCEGRFVQKYISTIGIDYGVKPVRVRGQEVKVNFFDTSGGDEFKEIRVEFYSTGETGGVMLVYDVTNRNSFAELEDWLEEARRHGCPLSRLHRSGESPAVLLCANKTDLPRRQVPKAEGLAFAQKHGMQHFETSACSGENVAEAMAYLFEALLGQHLELRRKLGAG